MPNDALIAEFGPEMAAEIEAIKARLMAYTPPPGLTDRDLDRLERLDREEWTLEHNEDGSD